MSLKSISIDELSPIYPKPLRGPAGMSIVPWREFLPEERIVKGRLTQDYLKEDPHGDLEKQSQLQTTTCK